MNYLHVVHIQWRVIWDYLLIWDLTEFIYLKRVGCAHWLTTNHYLKNYYHFSPFKHANFSKKKLESWSVLFLFEKKRGTSLPKLKYRWNIQISIITSKNAPVFYFPQTFIFFLFKWCCDLGGTAFPVGSKNYTFYCLAIFFPFDYKKNLKVSSRNHTLYWYSKKIICWMKNHIFIFVKYGFIFDLKFFSQML